MCNSTIDSHGHTSGHSLDFPGFDCTDLPLERDSLINLMTDMPSQQLEDAINGQLQDQVDQSEGLDDCDDCDDHQENDARPLLMSNQPPSKRPCLTNNTSLNALSEMASKRLPWKKGGLDLTTMQAAPPLPFPSPSLPSPTPNTIGSATGHGIQVTTPVAQATPTSGSLNQRMVGEELLLKLMGLPLDLQRQYLASGLLSGIVADPVRL